MIPGSAGRCRIDAIEPEVAEFQCIDEHIDRAYRIALVHPIIKAFRQQRRLLAIRISAASNALAGRLEPAREGIARALECNPDFRISNLRDLAPFRRAEDLAMFAKGLRKAGLPE